jgi:glycosyltransferase involved in cell wall biosynthesis
MRLMILTADYPPHAWSGVAAAVEAQAHALTAAGAEVHVVVGYPGPVAASRGSWPRVHRLDPSCFPIDPRRFDRVHLQSLSLAGLCFELRRRFGLPVTYTAHSLLSRELDPTPESIGWIRLQREVMRASDRVVFLSESERLAAFRTLPDVASRAAVIGNALPPPPPSVPRVHGSGPVVFAGRLTTNKGIELLCELLPRLMGRLSVRAVLAGGHGDASAGALIRRLESSLGGKCRVAGWLPRPSLRTLLSGASLVLVPSVYEPFGLIALEAMRLGTPVVASRTGGLVEIVTPDSGGCLATARDVSEWNERAGEILGSPDLWTNLHRRGPSYVAQRFPLRGIAGRLLQEAYV